MKVLGNKEKKRKNAVLSILAAQDFTNLNRLIEETINIAENLLDVDLVLYWQHKAENDEPGNNL